MKTSEFQHQFGIGLVEVLITTVVVAIGLLAIASFQNNLIRNSGKSKIRSEALALAEQTIEDLRNKVSANDYILDIPALTTTDAVIIGTNARFTRVWDVVDTGTFSGLNRKKISVQVGWDADDNGVAGAKDEERVLLVSELAWISPQKSAIYAAENDLTITDNHLNPRQEASNDTALEDLIGINLSITDLNTATSEIAGFDTRLAVDAPEPEHPGSFITIILEQIAPGSHFYIATHDATNLVLNQIEQGVIAVFLCHDADSDVSTADTCSHIKNHFGGVVLRHTGTVYSVSGNGLDHIQVAWASSSVNLCYTAVPTTTNDSDSMKYECIFAGNCNATDNEVNGCLADSVVSDTQINARSIKPGGEFGEVGLLGIIDRNEGDLLREEVCFLEDTAQNTIITTSEQRKELNEIYLTPATKRFYVSKRIINNGTNNAIISEGINRSYTNHNFLIIERKTSNLPDNTCDVIANEHSIVLAPRVINRLFDENSNNDVLDEFTYPGFTGNAIVTTGAIANGDTELQFYIEEEGSCYINSDQSAYACVISAGTASFTIKGGSSTHPNNTIPQSFATCTLLPPDTCNWTDSFQ